MRLHYHRLDCRITLLVYQESTVVRAQGVGPGGPDPFLSALAGGASGFMTGGPAGVLPGMVMGGVGAAAY